MRRVRTAPPRAFTCAHVREPGTCHAGAYGSSGASPLSEPSVLLESVIASWATSMIPQQCKGCRGPLASSRLRWWERGAAWITSRSSFRCVYCYRRCWIIADGAQQAPHATREIAVWPTPDVGFDPASLDSPSRPPESAEALRQTTDRPRRKTGGLDYEVIISITSSASTAAVTLLSVPRAASSFRRGRRLIHPVSDQGHSVEGADGVSVRTTRADDKAARVNRLEG